MENHGESMSEIHVLGPHTQLEAIHVGIDAQRPWLSSSPICEELKPYRIIHAGSMRAAYPFRVARMHQSGTFFMATFAGEGEVLVDGAWQRTGPEDGCLLPPHYPNGLRAIPGSSPWCFAWVRYLEPDRALPVAGTNHPVLAPNPSTGPVAAVNGLLAACHNGDSPAIRRSWVELLHGYVQQFAGPIQLDERVWKAWEAVRESLGGSWDSETIAQLAHVTPEHFRRMCQKYLGRSPMKHLAFLRIQEAMRLLHETDATVEAIAYDVGYHTAASFSKAFRKWTGHSPSELR